MKNTITYNEMQKRYKAYVKFCNKYGMRPIAFSTAAPVFTKPFNFETDF